MHLRIDRRSDTPIYLQISEGLNRAIVRGSLKMGLRLPSARELAAELGVNRLTVETAFDTLESAGLIERRHGSGTYVLPSCKHPTTQTAERREWPIWQQELFQVQDIGRSCSPNGKPLRYDFTSGMGDRGLIPAEDLLRCLRSVLRKEGVLSMGYETAQGYSPLRESIAEILSAQGTPARSENILITSGSQQAISLTAQALLRQGDTIFVEETCYDAALSLFRMLGMRLCALPMDKDGIITECIEPLLQQRRPGLLYCMPNFQNPTGRVLSAQRRQHLVKLATRYNFPILEDDYVGDLRYDGNALPSLKTLDPIGCVLHTSTFSKMLMPGLRLGYLMAEGPVMNHLIHWKRHLEISSTSVLQRALHAFISVGRYRRHVRRARLIYKERRDAMTEAIMQHFPKACRYECPRGGLFFWLRLPDEVDASRLTELAAKDGVGIAPGNRYEVTHGEGERHIRLNFAASEIPDIEEGVARLGRILKRILR